MSGNVNNQRIEAVKATFGEDVMQSETITCIADVAASLNSQYFVFYEPSGTKRYCWYNVGGTGVDPALSGATGSSVAISSGATAAAVASATQAVLDIISGFDCSVSGEVLTLVRTVKGYCKPSHDGAADTGFSFSVNYYGDEAIDLGCIDGDIEVSHEENYIDLTCHSSGTQVLGNISTGSTVSITLSLKETTIAQLRRIIGTGEGDIALPEGTGAGATEVFGWGTSRQFKGTYSRARKLVLHPAYLPAADKSRDLTAWKAFPKVGSITFSGENVFMIPVEFSVYPDYTINGAVRMVSYGDSSQTLTA